MQLAEAAAIQAGADQPAGVRLSRQPLAEQDMSPAKQNLVSHADLAPLHKQLSAANQIMGLGFRDAESGS